MSAMLDAHDVYESRPRTTSTALATFAPDKAAELDAYLGQQVDDFLYRWGSLFSDALIRVRMRFEGDMDQYLLLAVVQLGQLARAGRPPGGSRAAGINALSLSEITGIPRETTRRKLQVLETQGYVTRAADGLYYLGERYSPDDFFFDLKPLFWDAILMSHKLEEPAAGGQRAAAGGLRR